jgi:multidrug efflux pump
MRRIIAAAFARVRAVILVLVLILIAGAAAYVAIPKESNPDIPIPVVYVLVAYEGISPEDAERLLVRPLETELRALEGLDEIEATAGEGFASVTLEFDPGFDADAALDDVREAVDAAEPELPAGAEEPIVQEVNIALFPILTAVLAGDVPERTLARLADDLAARIEGVAGVLEVDIGGERFEMLEILISPTALESYGISFEALVDRVQRSNRLVAAGAIETGAGRLAIKVPGLIEARADVADIPITVSEGTVVTLGDVAALRRSFEDPQGFARINGRPAISLEVKKRVGANIIETVDAVRAVVAEAAADWPPSVEIAVLQDESEQIETMLGDLQNNVLAAILLVMVVVIATLGWRNALLVGLAIPGSFLAAILAMYGWGYTLNIVVLFSLILVVGMLVDGAIVTTELADRRLVEGAPPREAYAAAARRMAWPITAATATTLAVFVPLLFWSGVVGEFMKFLPFTVIFTLTASLFMALVFVPVLGSVIGRRPQADPRKLEAIRAAESGSLDDLHGVTRRYVALLRVLVGRPLATLGAALVLLVGSYGAYGLFGRGVEFFPEIEPELAQVQITSRDALSVWERDDIVREVEAAVFGIAGIESVYARTLGGARGASALEDDVIGVVQLDFFDWDERRPAALILADVRDATAGIPGVNIQIRAQEGGPTTGKPVQVELSAARPDALAAAVDRVSELMRSLGGLVDVADDRAAPGVEWRLVVDREEAARYGADVTLVGQAVQMVTDGILLAEYRPATADDEVEIRVRFPAAERTLERLRDLRVPTEVGRVPIANFVELQAAPRTGTIIRRDGRRVVTVSADTAPGVLASERIDALRAAIAAAELPATVTVDFAGQDEDQREAASFLATAFVAAILLMIGVLVTQFDSFYQTLLVLSAIVFSTAGVLLGLLVTGRPFGVVMGGIGVIALAGIVVNNNIVLIDAYNALRASGRDVVDAALRAGAQRLRPVVLTSVTTILGLMPMVLALNIDLVGRTVAVGAPSTQYWTELSSAIAGGLAFATLLTLLLTPAMLVFGGRIAERRRGRRAAAGAGPLSPDPADRMR